VAIDAAGDRARGATLYTTLEPCSHHGRTPPCADALVSAGITRVVVAVEDPDPNVSGRGVAGLRAAGVDVETGALAAEVARDLRPYLVHRRHGRAATLVKMATSLDGRTAAADGSSQWITGPDARADVHRLRADVEAVVVGSGTALGDQPALTARDVSPAPERQPLRVLLDARGRVPAAGPLFDTVRAPTLVLTTESASARAVGAWLDAGAEVHVLAPAAGGGVDLTEVCVHLGGRGVLEAMVEPGPTLAASLFERSLVDRLVVYVAPVLLGTGGRPGVALVGPASLADATRWHTVDVARLGDDVRLEYEAA
jgi:diaminohydroxyphosphoribosylaminopyrimidine deaminase/5-amino-6-(5-phosphoribosylamino)uracil reductase